MSPMIKNILLAILLVAVLWAGYTFFVKEDPSTITQTSIAESEAARDSRAFLLTLRQLNSITFDPSIFTDPRFGSLLDHRQPVLVEPVGRENPFEAL